MKTLFVSTCIAVSLVAGIWFTRPEYLFSAQTYVENSIYTRLFEREIHVNGARLLRKQRVLDMLPVHYSNLWWRMNPSAITRTLSTNPLVQSVAVEPCNFFSLRCFSVAIEERDAGLLAVLPDGVWLLGTDGGYMVSVAKKEASDRVRLLQQKRNLPLVYGLAGEGVSPQMVRSRALYVLRAREQLETSLDAGIPALTLHGNGELSVQFDRYPFTVVFDSSFENPERLTTELARLLELLKELKGKERAIARIDLAYEDSAVVTLTDRAQAAREQVRRQKKS